MSTNCTLKCATRVSACSNIVLYNILYTRRIGDITARRRMQYSCYADDKQFYMTVAHDECIVEALCKVEVCVRSRYV